MFETFFDTQEITAADLNNIALDLGNPTFANFDDDTTYNIDSLNGITQSLASKGIVRGDTNQCKCTIDKNAGKINIDTGLCIFGNGAKKRLSMVMSVNYTKNNITYIYLVNDISANKIYIQADSSNPNTLINDVIPLCSVSADETLTDMRIFSTAKVDVPTANQYYSQTFTDRFYANMSSDEILHEIDVGKPFKYAFSKFNWSFVELKENEKVSLRISSLDIIFIKKTGTKLTIYGQMQGVGARDTTYTINLA